jgi:hypothetical protein
MRQSDARSTQTCGDLVRHMTPYASSMILVFNMFAVLGYSGFANLHPSCVRCAGMAKILSREVSNNSY